MSPGLGGELYSRASLLFVVDHHVSQIFFLSSLSLTFVRLVPTINTIVIHVPEPLPHFCPRMFFPCPSTFIDRESVR